MGYAVNRPDVDSILLSVVMPAHNEARSLPRTVSAVSEVLETCVKDWEIIIVDDGSGDDTFRTIAELSKVDRRVKGLRLSRNFGKEAALLCGLKAAAGDVVITIDADLQHPPKLIPSLLDEWNAGATVVHAVKRARAQDGLAVRIRAAMFNRFLSTMSDIDVKNSSDFKLLDRMAVNALVRDLPERRRFYRGLAGWVGYPSASVEFDVEAREQGGGKWSSWRLVDLAVTAIVSFTSAPLRIVTILGLVTLLLGVVIGTDAIVSWFMGNAVSGFATLITTLLVVGSFIMISLGILGEYIAKIYDEIKHRPVYFVQDTVGLDTARARSARYVPENRLLRD
jgi:glycosyltransferase involved in cell wall biosynthesis